MISLFLNTSSNYLSIAIAKDRQIIANFYQKYDRDLSKEALFKIKELLSSNNISCHDVDEIICVKGPGSFTGLRVGVTIAKTMAYFLEKKLYSVSSLEVMASSVNADIIVPIIDARRSYVYGAIYDKNYNVLMKECYIALEELKQKVETYSGNIVYVSNDEFPFKTLKLTPDLQRLFNLSFEKEESSISFIPSYLKRTEAEEKRSASGNK